MKRTWLLITWTILLPLVIVGHQMFYEKPGAVTKNMTTTQPTTYVGAIKEWESTDQFIDMFKGSITSFAPSICLWNAEQIQEIAMSQGYAVSIAPTVRHYFYGKFVTKEYKNHAGVMIRVKDSYYFIDPNDWRVTKLW